MAQQMFNVGGVGKEKIWTEQTRKSKRQKIPSTIKISRTSMDQQILRGKRQKISLGSKTIKYVRPALDLLAILPSSPNVLAMDVSVELGKGSNRKQVI